MHHDDSPDFLPPATLLAALCGSANAQIPGNVSLGAARALVLRDIANGLRCPCCNQFAKVYKRNLNSAMAHALIRLYEYNQDHPDEWCEVLKYLISFGDRRCFTSEVATLCHWELLEAGERRNTFRITEMGQRFVRGEISIPRAVLLYNATLVGFAGADVNIKTALTTKFSGKSVMQSAAADLTACAQKENIDTTPELDA